MIPIRCLSCGKPVSAYFNEYQIRKIGGKQLFEELEDCNLTDKFNIELLNIFPDRVFTLCSPEIIVSIFLNTS